MRKLVTIRTVSEINPIEGADSIECLTIEGWKVVSQKGNFATGDKCVYFEIDSFLPDGNPLWQDLVEKRPRIFEGRKGHTLRTIRLRGQVSQGFVIPVSEFPEIIEKLGLENHLAGDSEIRDIDFAELLGVVKYEAPIHASLAGLAKGAFPSFIKKTDQERCQNLGAQIFADIDARYEVTMKLDGSSMTAFFFENDLGVCSRNLELKADAANANNTFVQLAGLNGGGLFAALNSLGLPIAVQGEVMGPSIQGNRESLSKPALYVFDIFDIVAREHLTPPKRNAIMVKLRELGMDLEIQHVPVIHADVSLRELDITNIEELLNFAEGPSIKHPVREGLVFKRIDGAFTFKVISNKFLLKQKD